MVNDLTNSERKCRRKTLKLYFLGFGWKGNDSTMLSLPVLLAVLACEKKGRDTRVSKLNAENELDQNNPMVATD
jgi:hypothetical protein